MIPPISRRQLHPEGSRTDAALIDRMAAIVRSIQQMLANQSPLEPFMGQISVRHMCEDILTEYDASRNSRSAPDAQVGAIGEPVAWQIRQRYSENRIWGDWETNSSQRDIDKARRMVAEGYKTIEIRPLYAAPQPPSAPSQSGEVTDAMVATAVRRLFGDVLTKGTPLSGAVRETLEAVFAQLQGELARLREERDWALSKAGITHGVYQELYQLRDQLAALQAHPQTCPQCGARWPTPQCDYCGLISNTHTPPRDSPREAE